MKLRTGSIMRCVAISSLVLNLAASAAGAIAGPPPAAQGTRDAARKKADLRLRVIDGATGKPLGNTAVEIYSDNGIRCIKAPCPTDGVRWAGRTDARGFVKVPGRVRQRSMAISVAGYRGKDLTRESKKEAAGVWVIALDAEGRPGSRDE